METSDESVIQHSQLFLSPLNPLCIFFFLFGICCVLKCYLIYMYYRALFLQFSLNAVLLVLTPRTYGSKTYKNLAFNPSIVCYYYPARDGVHPDPFTNMQRQTTDESFL